MTFDAQTTLMDSGDYVAVLVLLAVTLGQPNLAADLFGRLRATADGRLADLAAGSAPGDGSDQVAEDDDQVGMYRQLSRALHNLGTPVEVTTCREWMPIVARFTFRYCDLKP